MDKNNDIMMKLVMEAHTIIFKDLFNFVRFNLHASCNAFERCRYFFYICLQTHIFHFSTFQPLVISIVAATVYCLQQSFMNLYISPLHLKASPKHIFLFNI